MNLLDNFLDKLVDSLDRKKPDAEWTALKNEFNQAKQHGDLQQLLKKMFKSAQDFAAEEFPQIWEDVFNQKKIRLSDLSKVIYELADELSDTNFQTLLKTLPKDKTDFSQFIQEAASFCLMVPGEIQKRVSHIWGPLLMVALQSLGHEQIADALTTVITSKNKTLSNNAAFHDFNSNRPAADGKLSDKMLTLPDYQLPAGVLLSGLGLQCLIQNAALETETSTHDSATIAMSGLFTSILQTIRETSLKCPGTLDKKLVLQMFMDLIRKAQEDEEVEWGLLKMARFVPVGILLILAAILYCLIMHPMPWWHLLFKEIETDPQLKVKRLPAPTSAGPKYLIFSDIHRDSKSDRREPLEFGSFDHFSSNQLLYCEILDYAIDHGFTVIEAGDCDELWYFRDFTLRPKEKLKEIMETHQAVYERLVTLHQLGRYVRLYGNHDAAIRKPEIFAVLQELFDHDKAPEAEPFAIYDFAIIEDVKSMDESIINFGLDSEPYKLKMPLIVAHGHQWDFWNCDHNNIIGKLVVSTVATPVDFLDDPLIDAGGIAYSGNPAIDFADIMANAFILSSFPSYLPARKFAHEIQHLPDAERCTVDDLFYMETLAALTGATIGVRKHADSEEVHRANLLCLGHTHFPQSQPYYNLKKLLPVLRPWLTKLETKITDGTHGIIKPDLSLIKSRYFNSGTAGWMEGVIWAIQIDETGQARLVYWTRDTRPERPQMMDWELPYLDDELRNKLEQKKGTILNTIEELSTYIDPLIDSAFSSILRSLAAPFEELLNFFKTVPGASMTVESSESVGASLSGVFLSLLGSDEPKTHIIKIKIPDDSHQNLLHIKSFLDQFTEISNEDRLRLTCAWYLVMQHIPLLGASKKRTSQDAPDGSPVLHTVLGLIMHLPTGQNEAAPIQSLVTMEKNEFIIRITTQPPNYRKARTIDLSVLSKQASPEIKLRQGIIRLPDSLMYDAD